MLSALSDAVMERANQDFHIKAKVEGVSDSGWLVVDLGDVVVHLFSPDQRRYYQLEKLWQEAKVLLHVQ
jgi:ribosome-associated protein